MQYIVPWQEPIVEWKGWKFGTHGFNCILGYFSCLIFGLLWVQFRVIWCTLAKFLKRFSKCYYSHSFQPFQLSFTKSICNQGKYRLWRFLAICQILKIYGILKIHILRYIAVIHKAMLVSCDKRSSRGSRPPGPLVPY